MGTTPQRPNPVLQRRLPDPIADMKPTGKILKRLQQMALEQQASERNV